MNIAEITNLLNIDKKSYISNNITDEMLHNIDKIILSENVILQISPETADVYKKFVSMKQTAPDGMKNELFHAIRNFAKAKIAENSFADAILMLRFLIVKSELEASLFFDCASVIYTLIKDFSLAQKFLEIYEIKETNLPLKFVTLGNFYNFQIKNGKKAIQYYEQYLRIDETKSVIYTILANLYDKEYGISTIEKQIEYFEKAYKLKPTDRLTLHSLAFDYEKIGEKQKADFFYRAILDSKPTETDYYNYGHFLISCGDFKNGHKYFTHRFNIDDVNLKYPMEQDINRRWDFKTDLKDKTLLVHYEQGYGDTFMYCRFVPLLRSIAKKIIFVVQDSLYDLIKSSPIISQEIEILSDKTNLSEISYDYNIALLDVPNVLDITPETMPLSRGYLDINEKLVNEYLKKHIKKSNNIKIGIAYQGDKAANYNNRDIDFNEFKKLLHIQNADIYSFVKDEQKDDRIIALGDTFETFTDTACALKNMDIIISTDNVILNLAGALGVKTIGIFSKIPNFRWYNLTGENVGWYKSVTPVQSKSFDSWDEAFEKVKEIIKKETE